MGEPEVTVDEALLKRFVPINALAQGSLRQIAKKATIAEYREGDHLFRKGDRDGHTIYLLAGEIELLAGGQSVQVVAGSETARHPIGQHQPRQVDAVARSAVSCIQVETNLVDMVLTWQQSAVEVGDIEEDTSDDWMTRLLQNRLFLKLPPANIQKIMMLMEDLTVSEGDTLIRQGEEGDYYYYIRSGRCQVLRQPRPGAPEVRLAELTAGDSFGEEALVSDEKRNATVRMLTDGLVMRLAKKDFVSLIRDPLHAIVDYYKAEVLVSDGAAWLDVRLPDEYANSHINDAINIPLQTLRLQLKKLDKGRPYVIYCDTGRRSATAAFLMNEQGFEAHLLGGGLMNLPPEVFLVSEKRDDDDEGMVDLVSSQIIRQATRAMESSAAAKKSAGKEGSAKEVRKGEVEKAPPDRRAAATPAQPEQPRRGSGEVLARARETLEQARRVKDMGGGRSAPKEAAAVPPRAAPEGGAGDGATRKALEEAQAARMLLDQELRRTEDELASVNSQLEEMLQENQRLEVDLARQHSASEDAREELARLRTDFDTRVDEEREHGQARLAELTQRLRDAEAARDVSAREAEQAQRALETLRRERDEREADWERRISDAGEHNDEARAALQRELDEVRRARDEAEGAARESREASAALGEQWRVERQSLEARLSEEAKHHAEELTALHARLEEAHAARTAADADLEARLQQARQSHDEALATLRGDLDATRTARESAERARDELAGEVAALRTEQQTHQAQAEELETLRGALEKQAAELTELDGQLAAAREGQAALERARDELEGRNSLLTEELERAQTEGGSADRLRNELAGLGGRVADLEAERDAAVGRSQRLETELAALGDERDRAKEELEVAQRTLTRALVDKEDAEKGLAEAREAADSARIEQARESDALTRLREEAAALRDDLARVTGERDQALRAHEEVEGAAAHARDERKSRDRELKEELARLQDELAQYQQRFDEVQATREAAEQARQEAEERAARIMAEQEERHQALEGQIQEYQTVLARMEEELEQVGQITEEADSARRQSEGHVQRMAEEMGRMRRLLEEAEEEKRSAWQSRKQAEQEVAHARSEAVEAIRRANQEARKTQEDLQRARMEAEAEIQRRLEMETSRFQARDVEEMPAPTGPKSPSFHDASTRTDRDVTIGVERIRDTRTVTGRAAAPPKKGGGGVLALLVLVTVAAVSGFVFKDQLFAMLGMTPAGTQPAGATTEPPAPAAPKPATPPPSAAEKRAATPAPKPRAVPPAPPPVRAAVSSPTREPFRDRLRGGGEGPQMVPLAGGRFVMGDERSGDPSLQPVHEVTIRAFALGSHEVTVADYARFAAATGRPAPEGEERLPMVNVTWSDARAYANWLSEQTGQRYRLPSEAEWEYAARAGSKGAYWWGSAVGSSNANCFNCGSEWDGLQPAPTGSFRPNAFGLSDTAGNVAEWTRDCYQPNYAGAPTDGTAWESGECTERVVRGGSFASSAKALRSANRERFPLDTRLDNLGFRLARDL